MEPAAKQRKHDAYRQRASVSSGRGGRMLVVLLVGLIIGTACTYESRNVVPAIPETAQTSRVYASDGTLLTEFHAEENRDNVVYADFPPALIDAVVAIEDARFWSHDGVDVRAVMRAARSNAAAGEITQGGSTITQQLVKNVYNEWDKDINRKVQEASLAFQFERSYSKEQILELYLNTIYFGRGAYGVEAASQEYFGYSVKELKLDQAAMLAGMIQAPSAFNPVSNADGTTARRNVVLEAMNGLGMLSETEYRDARATPLEVEPDVKDDEEYTAGHFVEEVKLLLLNDPRFGATAEERRDNLFRGGLRIQTTIDLELQRLAEKVVAETLPDPVRDPDAAVVTIDPRTGHVLAMVGGRDFFGSSTYAKVNLATGRGRQAGSSFKPIVLATALAQGHSITDLYPAPKTIEFTFASGDPWKVSNYSGSGGGRMSLAEATIRSSNTVYAQLMVDVSPTSAVEMAHALGIDSPLAEVPALVLGTENVTVHEMAQVYGSFANQGVHVEPILVTRILRSDGTVVYQSQLDATQVLEAWQADQLTWVLSQAVDRGTGRRAALDGRPAAGKTGTAQGWRDAWFVGYTPGFTTAVWVGFPEGAVSMVPPRTPIKVTGGSYPAQIWNAVMTNAVKETPVIDFPTPPPSSTTVPLRSGVVDASTRGLVPNLVGRPAWWARQQLGARAIEYVVYEVATERWAPGAVIRQKPTPGVLVSPSDPVIIEVSSLESTGERVAAVPTTQPPVTAAVPTTRPEPVMPDLAGRRKGLAHELLLKMGMTVSIVNQAPPPTTTARPAPPVTNENGQVLPTTTTRPVPPPRSGTVWLQDPAPGTRYDSPPAATLWIVP